MSNQIYKVKMMKIYKDHKHKQKQDNNQEESINIVNNKNQLKIN